MCYIGHFELCDFSCEPSYRFPSKSFVGARRVKCSIHIFLLLDHNNIHLVQFQLVWVMNILHFDHFMHGYHFAFTHFFALTPQHYITVYMQLHEIGYHQYLNGFHFLKCPGKLFFSMMGTCQAFYQVPKVPNIKITNINILQAV